jgi:hypothetical protein
MVAIVRVDDSEAGRPLKREVYARSRPAGPLDRRCHGQLQSVANSGSHCVEDVDEPNLGLTVREAVYEGRSTLRRQRPQFDRLRC